MSSTDSSTRQPSVYLWMIVVLGALVALLAIFRLAGNPAPPNGAVGLRKLWVVPPFSLTERSGRNITNHDLSGKVWVADFVYTTCPGPCPLVTASLAKVQDAVAHDPNVQLVTFTVDPKTDTPDVLAKYAQQYGADPNRWWFLTGPEKQMYDLIQNGFYLAVQDNRGKPAEDGQFTVTHSTEFALVDGDGNVRGYYDSTSSDERTNLLRDIKVIEKEEAP